MQVGRIFLFQPTYHAGSPASHRAFMVGAAKLGDKCWGRLHLMQAGGSLLAATFNRAWTTALNLRECGAADITHFAMLHDDIVPEDGWLEILLQDLKASGADLVSAVVPIKDTRGLTSTAIDDPADEWLVERRLTMSEVNGLPHVFTAKDCGYPDRMLLVNTGCWVCRLDRPWVDAVDAAGEMLCKFEIRDRIVKRDGVWVNDVIPEDWAFSRAVQQQGGRVAATRRVKLAHESMITYPNRGDWGEQKWDHSLQNKFGAKPIPQDPLIPKDVRGWLTADEGRKLAELAAGKTVLEIGSFCGRSTIWMARTAEHVHACDTFDGRGTVEDTLGDTFREFITNLDKHRVKHNVSVHRCESTQLSCEMPDDSLARSEFMWSRIDAHSCDLVFIDGAHDEASVRADIGVAAHFLRDGGVVAVHDYGDSNNPGVQAVVDSLVQKQLVVPTDEQVDSLITFRFATENALSRGDGMKQIVEAGVEVRYEDEALAAAS